MVKQKLLDKRIEKKFTQEELAYKVGMETSSYNRRENGVTKISKKEWIKVAKELGVKLEDIYEPDDGIFFIKNENTTNAVNISAYGLLTMKKYIAKLEEENKILKAENELLRK
ncbi:helix-turn-helix transcriptional regulator [Chryseobacterium sp. CFS15]|uniref:helix-turn-helix transcriptional regulator n=1 Tax=Chryseobacterium sp. CFS15 TaxID=2986946 RepID=UPI00280908C6|nr:helix-turn-helix transcriptional regulator [Chryseobacterium sp. CFS15]MDQ8140569.1 helix-turn-helix transcriptional regulator [Chryseobacterium sp. CFS15]